MSPYFWYETRKSVICDVRMSRMNVLTYSVDMDELVDEFIDFVLRFLVFYSSLLLCLTGVKINININMEDERKVRW